MSWYNERVDAIGEALEKKAFELWVEIGERLVEGQKRYGGFKFADYDLDQMSKEEIEDWIVYIMAKRMLALGK